MYIRTQCALAVGVSAKKDAVFSLNNDNIQKYVRNLECEQNEMNENKKI